ncbi:sulfite exporter TauE/SafE family protein [Neobacillus notoginsengisoli]|uniref:Sulfite exporter TauE/SafE family protein n=1 Tax=Neobacillus notoginsengisoli TaxID=1578198 RepID=A0A417YXR3_9BACI|nr:sulfite exporter TauE/SafE family protein [Neobacillus notoginsengisoli]RHW42336.1 sulfite exporter TauE/SafE family protein [Neobacillus notoginsengisoli]
MYQLLTHISNFFSTPFLNMLHTVEHIPLLAAFMLGIIGAMAPCQLTGNISAITYYGNRSMQAHGQAVHAGFFILGKIIVFSGLGLIVWAIGHEFQNTLTMFFAASRKVIGPFIILLGLFLAGFFKMGFLNSLFSAIPLNKGSGKWGSFLMGVAFSISFCPTMFILFFVTLMPIVLSTPFGVVLPPVFAIGTSLPLIVFLAAAWYLGMDGSLIRKSRKIGNIVQKSAGFFLILIGLFDTITYW